MPDALAPFTLHLRTGLERSVAGVVAALRTVAFWVAVVLPAAYPAALAVRPEALPALLAGHAVAVALGHGHRPGDGPRSSGRSD